MNSKKIRQDFPIFGSKTAPREFVYLDSAATAQKPAAVIEALSRFYTSQNANIARGVYDLSEQATNLYEGVRTKVAQFVGAKDPTEIVFTAGTTAGCNMVADVWGSAHVHEGDEIVLTEAEHHANLLPWQRLASVKGARLKFLPIHPETFTVACRDQRHTGGEFMENTAQCVDPVCDIITSTITPKTKLVAITGDSNVLGPIWEEGQLKRVIARAHEVGARVLLDAAQLACHERINVSELGVDFLVFSAHKLFGPTGVGVLYVKRELHDLLIPYQLGGSMVQSATLETAVYKGMPELLEAGTPPIAQVIGLGAAIDWIEVTLDMAALKKLEALLCSMVIDGLVELGATIIGNTAALRTRGHLVSFVFDDMHAHDVASFLDMRGVAVRAGHHCAQPLVRHLGYDALLRVSFHCYNTVQDVELFLAELAGARAQLASQKVAQVAL